VRRTGLSLCLLRVVAAPSLSYDPRGVVGGILHERRRSNHRRRTLGSLWRRGQ
jgi:hypothetical protein